jgi:hypothetical protein
MDPKISQPQIDMALFKFISQPECLGYVFRTKIISVIKFYIDGREPTVNVETIPNYETSSKRWTGLDLLNTLRTLLIENLKEIHFVRDVEAKITMSWDTLTAEIIDDVAPIIAADVVIHSMTKPTRRPQPWYFGRKCNSRRRVAKRHHQQNKQRASNFVKTFFLKKKNDDDETTAVEMVGDISIER